jgi:hypothetical protein
LNDTSRSIDSNAQDLSVTVTTASGCAWTVTSDVAWIKVADAGSGSGNGVFRLSAAANLGDNRTGTVHAASQTFTVVQSGPCTYVIKPTFYNAGRGPDTVTIKVTAGTGCFWTARSNASWVSVDSGSSGSGNGVVVLQVQANDGAERSAVITIGGQSFALHQDGAQSTACANTIKPTYYHAGRGPDDIKIDVKADAGCTWTAVSTVSWVTVAEGAQGTGNGRVRLLVQPNDGPARQVTLTIAGQPFDLKQNGHDDQ